MMEGPLPAHVRPGSWLVLVLLAAGCVGSDSPADPAAPPEATREAVAPVEAIECPDGCLEATIAADAAGRIFVTTYSGTTLARSDDGGRTFRPFDAPPMPAAAPAGARHNDALLQTDAAGRLFFSSSIPGDRDLGSVFVARSDDGGETWATGVLLSLNSDPLASLQGGSFTAFADRQWLGIAPDGAVYASYSQVPSAIYLARSDDGGATFGPFLPAITTAERANFGQAGPPVVDGSGRILIPHLARASPLALPSGLATLRVSVSDDAGATFRPIDVHAVEPGRDAGYNLPIASLSPEGTVRLAWTSDRGEVFLFTSEDRGDTWSKPQAWSRERERTPTGAWVEATSETVRVLYFDNANGTVDLVAAREPTGGSERSYVTLARDMAPGDRTVAGVPDPRGPARTDFAHMALLPDGRAVVAWVDDVPRVVVAVLAR